MRLRAMVALPLPRMTATSHFDRIRTMKAGCYVLHLTCDQVGCHRFREFTGETMTDAMAKARKANWKPSRSWSGKDWCQEHSTEENR